MSEFTRCPKLSDFTLVSVAVQVGLSSTVGKNHDKVGSPWRNFLDPRIYSHHHPLYEKSMPLGRMIHCNNWVKYGIWSDKIYTIGDTFGIENKMIFGKNKYHTFLYKNYGLPLKWVTLEHVADWFFSEIPMSKVKWPRCFSCCEISNNRWHEYRILTYLIWVCWCMRHTFVCPGAILKGSICLLRHITTEKSVLTQTRKITILWQAGWTLEKTICMNINYNELTTIFRNILTQR